MYGVGSLNYTLVGETGAMGAVDEIGDVSNFPPNAI